MTTNQAVVVDQKAPGKLIIQDIAMPQTLPSEALVRCRPFPSTAVKRGGPSKQRMAGAQDGTLLGW
ncbi:MAG: hypothetical protein Ct9H300mP11_05790 [Chloroflexota bacterium]|nr:MAG: hypothetical protein Ct9H300mP11_05790 [Chloroflexota bacterium]